MGLSLFIMLVHCIRRLVRYLVLCLLSTFTLLLVLFPHHSVCMCICFAYCQVFAVCRNVLQMKGNLRVFVNQKIRLCNSIEVAEEVS